MRLSVRLADHRMFTRIADDDGVKLSSGCTDGVDDSTVELMYASVTE